MRFLFLTAVLCLTIFLFSSNEITAQVNQPKKKRSLADKGWTPNQNPTHYFLSPSAFNLKKGELCYKNIYFDLSFLNYGVTNWLSLGGGADLLGTLLSTVRGQIPPLYAFTPKIGIEVSKNLHFGAGFTGGIYGRGYAGSDSQGSTVKGLGFAFGNATYGSPDYNITLGAGIPFWTGENEFISPVIMINGICRISKNISLIIENWIMTSKEFYFGPVELLGYGFRWCTDNMSLDLGFYNNRQFSEFLFVGIPYIDIVYRFGQN